MSLLSKVKKAAGKAVQTTSKVAATPLKVVGGTAAKALGSKATFQDFDNGLKRLVSGKVTNKDLERATKAAGNFTVSIPGQVVHGAGNVVKTTVHAASEEVADVAGDVAQGIGDAVGEALQGVVSGLFGFKADGTGGKLLRAGLIVGAVVLTGGAVYLVVREVGGRDVVLPGGARVSRR